MLFKQLPTQEYRELLYYRNIMNHRVAGNEQDP